MIAGRFEIRALVGRGGYATVYRVRDRELKRDVALKVLRPERVTRAALLRLRREVNLARQAVSPHLVRVFDLGKDGATVFLTMELVEGESLRQRLSCAGRLGATEASDIAAQLLTALSVLHEMKTVHRDVKPENLLIAVDGTVKLADFGLARSLDDEQASRATIAGSMVGTADYISPEQALGKSIDGRSDLYAVGVVMFEMVTGELPFAGQSSLGSVIARLRRPPRAVRAVRRDVPYWFATIIARLLQRDPMRRYQSAREALHALRRRRVEFRSLLSGRNVAIALGFAFAAAAALLWPTEHQIKFARLIAVDRGIAAVATDGTVLWRRSAVAGDVSSQYALARLSRGARPLLATVLWSVRDFTPRMVDQISFLDPDTGAVVRQARVPLNDPAFPHDPRKFFPMTINTIDIDHDGVDEVFVSYCHVPEAPSFVVLYEPALDRSRVIFSGTGHHRFAGVHDIDGDGRAEVLVMGINNAFDWINALAAVRLSPWIGEQKPGDISAESPDMSGGPLLRANLVWYVLLPRSSPVHDSATALTFDDRGRRITARFPDRTAEIGMEGFLVVDHSSIPAARRNELRRAVYEAYRESNRLYAVGTFDEAIAEITKASSTARMIHEPILQEAMDRARGALLIRSGDIDEGERLMHSIWEASENRSEVAYDAAVACHLHGDVDRAVTWYERGMGRGASTSAGKSKHEFIQGEVLALAEKGRWKQAEDAIDRFENAYPTIRVEILRQFIRWRRGEMPNMRGIQLQWNATDVTRYWLCEFRLTNGISPSELLPEVKSEIDVNAQPQSCWRALNAELLRRVGRAAEAAAEAREAWDIGRGEASMSVIARAHLPLIRERAQFGRH